MKRSAGSCQWRTNGCPKCRPCPMVSPEMQSATALAWCILPAPVGRVRARPAADLVTIRGIAHDRHARRRVSTTFTEDPTHLVPEPTVSARHDLILRVVCVCAPPRLLRSDGPFDGGAVPSSSCHRVTFSEVIDGVLAPILGHSQYRESRFPRIEWRSHRPHRRLSPYGC